MSTLLEQAKAAATERFVEFKKSCEAPSWKRLAEMLGSEVPSDGALVTLVKKVAEDMDSSNPGKMLLLAQVPRAQKIDGILAELREKKLKGIQTAMLAAEAAKLKLARIDQADELAVLEAELALAQAETAIALASNAPEWARISDEVGQVLELVVSIFGGAEGIKAIQTGLVKRATGRFTVSPGDPTDEDEAQPGPGEQTFCFEAMDRAGQVVMDTVTASSMEEAVAKIRARDYFPTKLVEVPAAETPAVETPAGC